VRLLGIVPLVFLAAAAVSPPAGSHLRRRAPVRAAINDNRRAAGVLRDGVLTLRLDALQADWHPDGDDAPGASVPAFAEEGRAPSIPGPLVRVRAGTVVAMTVRNSLARTLTIRGLHDRTSPTDATPNVDAVVLKPGEMRALRFTLASPGTYYYFGSTSGKAIDWRIGDDAELTGVIVVDSAGAPPPNDRILVFGIWADTVGRSLVRNTRLLATVNGRSWPHTERFEYMVGDTVRWRMINATADFHPMHLHGFYYMVDSRGDGRGDTTFAPPRRERVNTAGLLPGATATMTWVPERAGNWLFHCHIPEHFAPRGPIGMPRSETGDVDATHHAMLGEAQAMNHALEGMNGLVTGVTVRSRTGSVARTDDGWPRRALRLLVRRNVGSSTALPFYEYALASHSVPAPDSGLHVGPAIVLKRGEPVSITVVNQLDEPTAVHWHGIELESYFDGVAGFSGAGSQISPAIAPHDSFVARFTPPRTGTFIYHTHVNESRQQLAGLAGPIIVLEDGVTLDSARDHTVLLTTMAGSDAQMRAVLMNGSVSPGALEVRAGVAQRLRLINITSNRPNVRVELWRGDSLVTWRPLAKDGAELPVSSRVKRAARSPISIGETMDYEFVPREAGEMRLEVRAATGQLLATMPIVVRP
jgi:FtsP/CotA-like multicopper oxidase with cupredoxin domain